MFHEPREVIDVGLREVRTRRGLSQAELGRRMSIDPSVVRHVEAGRLVPYPRFRRLAAEILGCKEEQIFGKPTHVGKD
jgi:ribosome-binding protein aMBF1 (putative translation factor)